MPVLALNEVFLGESLSSRVSYLEVKFDNNPVMKTRNSGLCISTGTGSTSWTFNISKLTHQSVETILKYVFETTRFPVNFKVEPKVVLVLTQPFADSCVVITAQESAQPIAQLLKGLQQNPNKHFIKVSQFINNMFFL